MTLDPEQYHRRSIRLQGYDYAQVGAYFVTIVTRGRECLFGEIIDGKICLSEYGRIVTEVWPWLSIQYPYVELDEWIVMPNHFHGILMITGQRRGGSRTAPTERKRRKSLGQLIGVFKTISTKHINAIFHTPGLPLWQRNYYEHIIRNERSLDSIRRYITHNPLRWAEDEENPLNNPKT